MSDTSLYLIAKQEAKASRRFRRLMAGATVSGVEFTVDDSWVGACVVSFLIEGVRRHDVLPSVDEAWLVAGLLSSPTAGVSEIRVLPAAGVDGSYRSAVEWGRSNKELLGELLNWWAL
ncbi:hypothetical protein P3W55_11290 [Pseudomonas citronellolis]|uniref:Uncharacterized protein n=1 Tax=Pseudomonas citronellolis TaxID=53408 RepID=A0AAW6P7J2_9PSED|nr:hypothetical protein [Pseudomonas citronellolis]MDF3842291.1 hypothetical protein [Pseudomonas citronellolis]